jgi:hypothetical protein
MGEVLNLGTQRPHLSGEAICKACDYEWVAVAPVGTIELECPECGTEKGLYKYSALPQDSKKIWVCNCGCDVFRVLVDGFICYMCGIRQKGF